MNLILLPHGDGPLLTDIYQRALRNSAELYIVSAYLTEWNIDEVLWDKCESFLFIVGKDFGITRKAACEKVINWLPKNRKTQFLAAESIDGFHPKAVFWRELDDSCHALIGSSNLSKAAFSTNHEANGYSKISTCSFNAAKKWIRNIENGCVTLDHSWLALYREAVQPKKAGKSSTEPDNSGDHVVALNLPITNTLKGLDSTLGQRRKQIQIFEKNKKDLESLFRKAAASPAWDKHENLEFYNELQSRWVFGDGGSRFQGAGWERRGKGSNFKAFSQSLIRVLNANESARDEVVATEIDSLYNQQISTRGALFSEMLCQFFPSRYHVIDKPISGWLTATEASHSNDFSEGQKYVNSARLLRAALTRSKNYPAKNLAELDAVIWLAANQDKFLV